MRLSGWGRYPVHEARLRAPRDETALRGMVAEGRAIARGNYDLFQWTLGGMGLTGVILRAAFRLRKVQTAWIKQSTLVARNLDHAIDLFEHNDQATYSVAWIDCLQRGEGMGRAVVMLGEHASIDELGTTQKQKPFAIPKQRKRSIPFDLPNWTLNRLTVSAFNSLYFRNGLRNVGEALVDWDTYFYPLDAIDGWNKIYGRRGFVQFQCVMPGDIARRGLDTLLRETSEAQAGSFLAVLKKLGPSSGGISFPMEGYPRASLRMSWTERGRIIGQY